MELICLSIQSHQILMSLNPSDDRNHFDLRCIHLIFSIPCDHIAPNWMKKYSNLCPMRTQRYLLCRDTYTNTDTMEIRLKF